MPTSVTAKIGRDRYQVTLTAGNNTLIADEPLSNGGQDKGFAPTELLVASLGACTSVTLRMYADRKQMNLDGLEVSLQLDKDDENNITHIRRDITLTGNLTDEEKQKLLTIANKCPVHKILTSNINIETKVV
jgi:putative redox protein